jgi:hypothetical protein
LTHYLNVRSSTDQRIKEHFKTIPDKTDQVNACMKTDDPTAPIVIFSALLKIIHPAIKKYKEKQEIQNLRNELFGNLKNDVSVVHPDYHPIHGSPPKNGLWIQDMEIMKNTFGSIFNFIRAKREIQKADTFIKANLWGNLCSLGSPASNSLTKIAMGFNEKMESQPFIKLPYNFQFDVDYSDKCLRWEGGKIWDAPQWYIRNTINDKAHRPSISSHESEAEGVKGSFIRGDLLLITVIPNMFRGKKIRETKTVTIFAGCHSTGGKAAALLLNDKDILDRMIDQRESSYHFQTLVEVTKLKHNMKKNKFWSTIPLEIKHIDTIPIDIA